MKIAVTSTEKTLSSTINPRFGRAAYFIIVDPETMDYRVVENSQNFNLPQGAGIQAAKTIIEHHVETLITGNCGPKAFRVLKSAGIDIITGAKGTVDEVIKMYKKGELRSTLEPNVEGHWA